MYLTTEVTRLKAQMAGQLVALQSPSYMAVISTESAQAKASYPIPSLPVKHSAHRTHAFHLVNPHSAIDLE